MGIYLVDPLQDRRWEELLVRHPRASVFHSCEWLSALRSVYGYVPIVMTTAPPGTPLESAVLACEVESRITGRRLVSLPFSDHCEPLADTPSEQAEIWTHVRQHVARRRCRYAEMRPVSSAAGEQIAHAGGHAVETFCLHRLSLDSPLEVLFSNLHRSCIQRNIRRAERERLAYERGRSDALLRPFYRLLLRTRRRQGLPPQSLRWFRHLIASMGDRLTIRVAFKDGRPVAAILTVTFRDTVTYKYGCSDERFHTLGATPFLFWKTIEEAKHQGMRQLDLGRSDVDNAGLVVFKDRLGAGRTDLRYYRFTPTPAPTGSRTRHIMPVLKRCCRYMPDAVLAAAGRILYRHFG